MHDFSQIGLAKMFVFVLFSEPFLEAFGLFDEANDIREISSRLN